MQEQIAQHPRGQFCRCYACGQEPRHVISIGRSSNEAALFSAVPLRHMLECSCGRHTMRYHGLDAAQAEWNTRYGLTPVRPLRVPA